MKRVCGDIFLAVLICWGTAEAVGDARQDYQLAINANLVGNYTQAAAWFRKAAELGRADAQYNLALICYDGLGVTQNYQEALSWFTQAAEQGHVESQWNLGRMYFRGQGVAQNFVAAYTWWSIAATNGFSEANDDKAIAEESMTVEQIAEGQRRAIAWLAEFGRKH